MPDIRKVAKKYLDLPLKKSIELLKSPIHEERLFALLIIVLKFRKTKTEAQKKAIYKAYLANTKYINNWDLVDLSCHEIVGGFLLNRSKKELYDLSKSKSLWERRISIVSTYKFIRNGRFKDTLKIAGILLKDKHDLIHKATGWMLRETGKRDLEALESFLNVYYKSMPRTMLRYSIEKFPENKRLRYLNGEV